MAQFFIQKKMRFIERLRLKSISSSFKEEPEKKERKKSRNKATKPSSSKKKADK
jgi:hypothetical protein